MSKQPQARPSQKYKIMWCKLKPAQTKRGGKFNDIHCKKKAPGEDLWERGINVQVVCTHEQAHTLPLHPPKSGSLTLTNQASPNLLQPLFVMKGY